MSRARKPINKPASGISPELKIMGVIGAVVVAGVIYSMSSGAGDAPNADGKTGDSGDAVAEASLEAYSTGAAAHGNEDAKAVLVKYTDFQ